MAREVYAEVGFVHAVTGWDASMTDPADAPPYLGLLVGASDRLVEQPVERWDFGGPG